MCLSRCLQQGLASCPSRQVYPEIEFPTIIIMYVCMYGHVTEWLKWQRSNHATRVLIPLRSIYQECEFLIKLAWEMNSVRGTFGKCLKTIPRVDPSRVSRQNCTEAIGSYASMKSQIIITEG